MMHKFLLRNALRSGLLLLAIAGLAVAQDSKPNVQFGRVQVVIQLPANPGIAFTCSNLKVALKGGGSELPPVEGPVKTGVNACSAKFDRVLVGIQYAVLVKPAGVTCPLGKQLQFALNWLSPTTFTLTQAGQTSLRQGQVTTVNCQ